MRFAVRAGLLGLSILLMVVAPVRACESEEGEWLTQHQAAAASWVACPPESACLLCSMQRAVAATARQQSAPDFRLRSSQARSSGDSPWNGLLIGAGVGFALGLVNQGCTVHGHCIAGSTALFAAVGALVDALH